ncbi:MAG TPA: DUF4468 domain-containing protein [Flavobacterium sp.]|nr:DUF4468 domain-containing protein [Flavobacterium sp.]
MKALFTIFLFCFVSNTFAQIQTEKFEYSATGLNKSIVIEIPSKTKEEIFNKTMNWVKETWTNPDIVLKMKIDNEKIRVGSIAKGLIKVKGYAFDLNYIIEISFKDNKYKFDIISLTTENTADYLNLPNFKTEKRMIKNFGSTPTDIENYFNALNQNLKNYILGTSEEKW